MSPPCIAVLLVLPLALVDCASPAKALTVEGSPPTAQVMETPIRTADGTSTSSPFLVSNLDCGELELASRLFESRGYRSIISISLQCHLGTSADVSTEQKVLDQLRDEFGVDFRRRVNHRVKVMQAQYAVSFPTPIAPKQLLETVDRNSLLGNTLRGILARGYLPASCTVHSYRYSIRPWMSKDLKRCETVQGTLTAYVAGTKTEFALFLPDSAAAE